MKTQGPTRTPRTRSGLRTCLALCALCLLALAACIYLIVQDIAGPPRLRVPGKLRFIGRYTYRDDAQAVPRLLPPGLLAPVSPECRADVKHYLGFDPWGPTTAAAAPVMALPPRPPHSSDLAVHGSFADSAVAAAVYGNYNEDRPCVLAIRTAQGVFHRQLYASVRTFEGTGFRSFAHGKGLVVGMELAVDTPDYELFFPLYVVQAPAWQPVLVHDSRAVVDGRKWWLGGLGQSLDGNTVWLAASSQADWGGPPALNELWSLDCAKAKVERICPIPSYPFEGVLPSPDESRLALLIQFVQVPFTIKYEPVCVVDLTKREARVVVSGPKRCAPVAWSATVANRLYFTATSSELWQVDMR